MRVVIGRVGGDNCKTWRFRLPAVVVVSTPAIIVTLRNKVGKRWNSVRIPFVFRFDSVRISSCVNFRLFKLETVLWRLLHMCLDSMTLTNYQRG